MQYNNEHISIGETGNAFVIAAFVFSLFASFSYFISNKKKDSLYNSAGNIFLSLHIIAVAGIIATLFYMLLTHKYEYYYVWQHSSNELPLKYILSCFWEGQEGSFLLWIFWHCVLSVILLKHRSEFSAPALAVVSLVQAFLCSMLLGIYVFDYKIGSNPFTLLTRMHPDFINLPFTKNPDYLATLNGRGLNPLLQNWWMTIHPPVLFLGFAATLFPFALAIAGLINKRFTEWQKHALPWIVFGVGILGVGILMGGAWAYEALSFGGFWAWDPVENSSLVPWLVLVGALHIVLINIKREQAVLSGILFTLLSFLLILYSTFLTRSGILGNSSVHSFTDMGMSGQLLIYLLAFVFMSIVLITLNFKRLTALSGEEKIWSREFWMFIGALILLLSSFQIIFTTSFPVINKLFGTSFAVGAESAIKHYNQWQLPFALLLLLITAFAQFLKYKNSDIKKVAKQLFFSISVSVALALTFSYAFGWLTNTVALLYCLLLFSSFFCFFSNLQYIISVLKGNFRFTGASVAHSGFALLIAGALISMANSEIISVNKKHDVEFLGKDFSNRENILLVKNDTIPMGKYFVTYTGKTKEGIHIKYHVDYLSKDTSTGIYKHEFTLAPFIQLNDRMGNAPEPDTRHYLLKDVYTHVRYADLSFLDKNNSTGEYKEAVNSKVGIKDTVFAKKAIIVLEELIQIEDTAKHKLGNVSLAVGARLQVFDYNKNATEIMPIFAVYDSIPKVIESEIPELGMRFALWNILPNEGKVEIAYREKNEDQTDFIVMKAVVFPMINLLWMGCIIMFIGTLIALYNRVYK